jgi:uncharacterized membrane protein YqgA involved in biofilm formation
MLNLLAKLGAISMALEIHSDSWKETLPILVIGMVGIFLVIGVIILITYGLNKLSNGSKKKNKKKDDNE